MARLETYRAKRDRAATPEPFEEGAPSAGALRYSIQNHDATRLHWDLRLEWDGVLLSWAVTRGPSLNPADKRLAVRTEDHPIPYLTFEGSIPAGQYGAGTVMLWDVGHWRPLDDVEAGLAKGHLRFQLYGRRMTGLWDLVRMKGKSSDRGRENWLLVKAEDAAGHRPDPVERYVTSVATGRDFAGIAAKAPSVVAPRPDLMPLPGEVEPMLVRLVDAPPQGDDWLHEIKIDGYRGLVHLGQGGPVIRTRNGLDWTQRFASLLPALAELPARAALIDGEIVAGAGAFGFSALQQAITAGGPFAYVAFDLLSLDGRDLRGKPLVERRAALERLLADAPPMGLVQLSEAVPGNGLSALQAICAVGGEGIVSKLARAPYVPGRSDSWRKTKCERRASLVVIGWAKSGSPGRPFASLVLASPDGPGGALRYRGRVGTGFSAETQADLAARMRPLARKTAPAPVPRPEAKGVRWVEPQLVAEVRYAEMTADDILRHASFLGLREDKMPPERPSPVVRIEKPAGQSRKIAGVTVTSADRVVFPESGVTKGEIAEWYERIAPLMLPFCADRPLALVRLPEGLGGERFFQKHAGKGFPAQMRTTPIEGENEPAIYVASAAGLVAGAQMGVVEYHIRGTRRDRTDRPDRLVFDLDPDEGLDFAEVKAAAFQFRDRLAALGLPTWPLVTGGKGIHVVADLRRTVGWDTVKLFARAFANLMAAEEPERYVAVMSKAKRQGKIFIDWLRNEEQATAISPFSLRARAGASVAMPVSWEVLEDETSASGYDLRTAAELAPKIAPKREKPVSLESVARRLLDG